jgi:DNA-binding LacI/PurR family transcriptional regulator
VLERLLAEQGLGVAWPQQRKIASSDPHDFLDDIHRPRIADISAPPRVTSIDVARRAGVSQSTVSLVLSGKARGRISARTEEAVRAAAAELGYRPNVAARALRTGVARSVALVVPDITNPFFGRVLRGAQRSAQRAGYTVVLVDIGNNRAWEATSLQALLAGPADGLLLFEADLPPGASEHAIQIEMLPGGLPVVRIDVEAGTDLAVDHLLGLGHTKIGHVASSFVAPTFAMRRARIAERLGAPPPTVEAPFTFEQAAEAAAPLLEQDVTAVFCDDDILAGGVYLAARARGVRIPEDLSVVGFDDLDFARVLAPPLTTVAVDAEALGAAAFDALARDLSGEAVAAEQVLPVSLCVRESTAAI